MTILFVLKSIEVSTGFKTWDGYKQKKKLFEFSNANTFPSAVQRKIRISRCIDEDLVIEA